MNDWETVLGVLQCPNQDAPMHTFASCSVCATVGPALAALSRLKADRENLVHELGARWRELLDHADESDDVGDHVGFARYYRSKAEGVAEAQGIARAILGVSEPNVRNDLEASGCGTSATGRRDGCETLSGSPRSVGERQGRQPHPEGFVERDASGGGRWRG